MNSRFLTGVAAAALCAFVGSDSLIDSARSLTIPTYCVSGEQCAALCRGLVEVGSTPQDFVQRASYELARPILPACRPPI